MKSFTKTLQQGIEYIFWQHGGLAAVIALALYIRVWLLQWWNAFPFGDVFNYVRIAQALAHFSYPVIEKRLPFYPLLILLVHSLMPMLSWENAAIGIAIAMSLVSLILLYAIARALNINKTAALVGVLIFMSYQPFLAYSIRGYADSTFIALILAGILALFYIETTRAQVALTLIGAALPITRYEGAFVSLIFGFLAVWYLRHQWKKLILMAVLSSILFTPYILIASRSGHSLLPQAYLSQAGQEDQGYGVDSLNEWGEKYLGIWTRLGLLAVWYVPRNLISAFQEDPLGWHQQILDQFAEPRYAVALLAIPGALFLLIYRRSLKLLVLILPFLAVAAASAWWAPLIRYDAMIFPFIVLLGVAGVHSLLQLIYRGSTGRAGKIVYWGALVATLFIATSVWMLNLTQDTQETLRKSRFRELAYYEALKVIRVFPERALFEDDRAFIETYFGDRAVYSNTIFKKNDTADQRWQKLKDSNIHYALVSHTESSPLAFIPEHSANNDVQEIAHFKVEQGNNDIDEWSVYKINTQP